jgi:predicted methyltransferase
MKTAPFLVAGILLLSTLQSSAAPSVFPIVQTEKLQKIINGPQRSKKHRARDQFRHPLKTLSFFDVQDDMTVIEIWPGGGWYTEILAPFLKEKGHLYAAGFDPDSSIPYFSKNSQRLQKKIDSNPAFYGKVEITVLQPPKELNIAPPESVDRVLTFRNVHNWTQAGAANEVFMAMYKALKPGGILGVVEHRGNPSSSDSSGYVQESMVIDLAEKVGFKLLDKSELNANPRDSKNHPKGVWTLPPTLSMKSLNRERYLAIGESDRMTLKFLKP